MIESRSLAGAASYRDANWSSSVSDITKSKLCFQLLGNVEPEEMLGERDTVLERLAADARKLCWSWARRRVRLPAVPDPAASVPSVGPSAG